MTVFMKIIFSVLLILNAYLFATVGDATKADIIQQTKLIPTRISNTIEVVSLAIQERRDLGAGL